MKTLWISVLVFSCAWFWIALGGIVFTAESIVDRVSVPVAKIVDVDADVDTGIKPDADIEADLEI